MPKDKFYYTRGKCEGDVCKVWIGTRPPYRSATGRMVTFYRDADCECLFTVHSPAEFQRLFGHDPIEPDSCIEIESLVHPVVLTSGKS